MTRTQEERDAIARELGYRDAASVRRPLAKVTAPALESALTIIARLRREIAERNALYDALIAELRRSQ